jgi:hypothetical protein
MCIVFWHEKIKQKKILEGFSEFSSRFSYHEIKKPPPCLGFTVPFTQNLSSGVFFLSFISIVVFHSALFDENSRRLMALSLEL